MAEKLSVQIALEGGAEVERQLASIGEAGKEAFDEIKASADKVGGFDNLDPSKVTATLNNLGIVGPEAFKKIEEAVKSASRFETLTAGVAAVENQFDKIGTAAERAAAKMTRSMGPIGALARALGPVGIAAGLLGASMVKGVVDAVGAIDQLNAAAAKLGTTTEKLSQLRNAFAGTGITTEGLVSGLEKIKSAADAISLERIKKDFNDLKQAQAGGVGALDTTNAFQRLAEAAKGFGPVAIEARKMLVELGAGLPGTTKADIEALGVELARLKGMGFDIKVGDTDAQKLVAIVDGLSRMPEGAERSAIAMQHLGDAAGAMVLDMLRAGVALDEVKAKAAAGGGGITPEQIEAAARYNIAIRNLTEAWQNFNSVAVAPALTGVFNELTSQIQKIQRDLGDVTSGKGFVKFDFAGSGLGQMLVALGAITGDELKGVDARLNAITQSSQQAGQSLQVTAQATQTLGQATQGLTGTGLARLGDDANAAAAAYRQLKIDALQMGSAGQQGGQQAAQGTKTAEQAATTAKVAYDELVRKFDELARKQISVQVVPINWSLVTAGLDAAVTQISTAFNSIKLFENLTVPDFSGAVTALQAIQQAATDAGSAITAFASALAGITWGAIDAGTAAWNALSVAIDRATSALVRFNETPRKPGPSTGTGGGSGNARGGLLGGRGSGTSDSNLAWVSRGEYIMPARAVRQPGVLAFLEALRRSGKLEGFARGGLIPSFQDGGQIRTESEPRRVLQALAPIIEKIGSAIESIARSSNELVNSLDSAAQSLVDLGRTHQENLFDIIQQLIDAQKSLLDIYPGKARGGLLGGRGTGTSDSNLAWLSRGEYITPARAVAQPGVLAFLEALRRSGGNLREVLDGMGRFALGGLVPQRIPAFAGGGLAGGMSNVTIQFPGLDPISGLRAPAVVVDELRKAAALAQVRSGGRKPSRYS